MCSSAHRCNYPQGNSSIHEDVRAGQRIRDCEWSKVQLTAAARHCAVNCISAKGGKNNFTKLSSSSLFFFLFCFVFFPHSFVFLADSCLRQDAASTGDLALFHSHARWLLVAMEKPRNGADNSSMREQRLGRVWREVASF